MNHLIISPYVGIVLQAFQRIVTYTLSLNAHNHLQEGGTSSESAEDCHLFLSLAKEGCHLYPNLFMVTLEQGEKESCSMQLTNP